MVEVSTFTAGVLLFIKTDLLANITDPKSGTRPSKSSFVMTSYPKKEVVYPLITLKIPDRTATRAGMQTVAMDITVPLEVRIWALNEKDKNDLYDQIFDRLRNIQFTTGGSIDNNLHDFAELSAVEVDEEGDLGTKSRILTVQYRFFNVN